MCTTLRVADRAKWLHRSDEPELTGISARSASCADSVQQQRLWAMNSDD